jgi:DNA-binding MarR family transcriptional regulator
MAITEKTTFVLIPFLKDADVPIHARITLGGVIYRNRLGVGATISGLAKRLGFDRNTVKRHLKKLASYLYSEEGRWFAKCPLNNPLEYRYVWKNDDRTCWHQAIRTIKAKSLRLPITPERQRVIVPLVLYDVLSFVKSRQSKSGLAKMLGVGRPTVDRALSRLVDRGLITMTPLRDGRGIVSYDIKVLSAEEKCRVKEEMTEEAPPVEFNDARVLRQLDRTLAFLTEQSNGEPTPATIRGFIETGDMRLWAVSGKVSYYYLCLSPLVNKETMGTECSFESTVYEAKISQAVRQSFAERFAYEYG